MPARLEISHRAPAASIVRFDVAQRAQHTLMIVSFVVLALSGLPMRYSGWGISSWWMNVWGGIDNLRAAHRYAAWVMIAVCAYHIMYVLVKRPFPTSMLPKAKDVRDFIQELRHTFRLSKEAPQFDRFSYRNKFAYWLVYAGAFVMIVTGLVLMYPIGSTEAFGGWSLPLALIIHSDAAILAIGWMIIVHMYFAHFSRHTFPLDKAIFTGRVPIERYRVEYPLEYARIMAANGIRLRELEDKRLPSEEEWPEEAEPVLAEVDETEE